MVRLLLTQAMPPDIGVIVQRIVPFGTISAFIVLFVCDRPNACLLFDRLFGKLGVFAGGPKYGTLLLVDYKFGSNVLFSWMLFSTLCVGGIFGGVYCGQRNQLGGAQVLYQLWCIMLAVFLLVVPCDCSMRRSSDPPHRRLSLVCRLQLPTV